MVNGIDREVCCVSVSSEVSDMQVSVCVCVSVCACNVCVRVFK